MLRGRVLLDIAAHIVWKVASRATFGLWRRTGLRPKYLSSKGQDRWVVTRVFPGLRNGFFVELGAGNGFTGSDTFVLEREYGWDGICIEANPVLFRDLTNVVHRRCACVNTCVDRTQGTVQFAISDDTSGIVAEDTDNSPVIRAAKLSRLRSAGMIETVATKTIGSILDENGAPGVIHYLSVDVEGAEERVLAPFPFDRYRVMAITVERPTPIIHRLLIRHGFALARQRWHDGFYVQRELLPGAGAVPQFRRKEF